MSQCWKVGIFLQADYKHTQNNALKQNRNLWLKVLVIFASGITVMQSARAVLINVLRRRSRFQRIISYQKTNSWKTLLAEQSQRVSSSAVNVSQHFTKFVLATSKKRGGSKMKILLVIIVHSKITRKRYCAILKLKVRSKQFL